MKITIAGILLAQHNEVVAEWCKLTLSLVICQPPRKKKS